jgi:hypothetical protein
MEETCPVDGVTHGAQCYSRLTCEYPSSWYYCTTPQDVSARCEDGAWNKTTPAACPDGEVACDVSGAWSLSWEGHQASVTFVTDASGLSEVAPGSSDEYEAWRVDPAGPGVCGVTGSFDWTHIVDTGGTTCGKRGLSGSVSVLLESDPSSDDVRLVYGEGTVYVMDQVSCTGFNHEEFPAVMQRSAP